MYGSDVDELLRQCGGGRDDFRFWCWLAVLVLVVMVVLWWCCDGDV